MIVPMGTVLGLSAVIMGIGVFGFLARRNIILMFVSIEVMLNAVNLSLAGFSRHLEDPRGQILALFVIAVAAAEVILRSQPQMPMIVSTLSSYTNTVSVDCCVSMFKFFHFAAV